MICSYCGASYRENAVRCPNCRSENPKMVEKRKAKVRNDIDEQAREAVKDLPEKKVKKLHTIVVAAIAGVLAFLVIGGIVIYAVNSYRVKIEYAIYEKNVAQLEEYAAKENWDAFCDYYGNHECWESKYDKYSQLYDVRYDYKWLKRACENYHESMQYYAEHGENYQLESAEEDLMEAFEVYSYVYKEGQKYVNDRVIWGNEKWIKQWMEEATTYLQESLSMTEEELLSLQSSEDEADWEPLARRYIERDRK